MLKKIKSFILGLGKRKFKALLKRYWKIYETYALIVGLSAILYLIYGLTLGFFLGDVYLSDNIKFIAVLEIILGLLSIPYYPIKVYLGFKKW